MAKKLNKFERLVLAELKKQAYPSVGKAMWLYGGEIVELLRQYHMAFLRQYHQEVVELVKGNLVTVSQCGTVKECQAHNGAIKDVLRQLKELTQ